MGTNQKGIQASKIEMDARRLLRAINSSTQSKLAFFESAVKKLGQSVKHNYKLVSLNGTNIIFEDTDFGTMYLADTAKIPGNKYRIDNVREINIKDSEKTKLFEENCEELLDTLAESDYKNADKIWKRIESQRFRSRIIPDSGYVTTRDGITRKYNVTAGESREIKIASIVEAIVDSFRDNVDIVNGDIVCGVFSEDSPRIVLPVDELVCRRVVARNMKDVAVGAYQHKSFQRVVRTIAGNISNKNLQEAVKIAAKFLGREQEFCLLSESETRDLIDNALATQRIFNNNLVKDTAKLFYLTNIRVNHQSIIESWAKTAQQANSADLMEAVETLRSSKNFSKDYGKLLNVVFEDSTPSNQELRDKAYAAALHALAGKIGRDTPELAKDMINLASSLSDPSKADTAVRQDAEAILGAAWSKLGGVLSKYEEFGGGVEDEEAGVEDEMGGEEELGEPIEFSPSLSGAGELGAGPEGEPGDEMGDLGGLDMGAEAGMGAPGLGAPGAPAAGAAPPMGGMGGMGAPAGGMPGLPESKQVKTYIEDMSVQQLSEELAHWQTDGHIYLKEDGFDDCFNQMRAYMKRCEVIKNRKLFEAFEKVRDFMVESGTDVLDDLPFDRYDGFVVSDDIDIDDDYLSEDSSLRMSKPYSDADSGGQTDGEFRGKGLQSSSLKKTDGRSGLKAAGSGDAAAGDGKSRMKKGIGPHKGQGEPGWDNLDDVDGKKRMKDGIGPHKGQGGDGIKTKGKGPKGQDELSEDKLAPCPKCDQKGDKCTCPPDAKDDGVVTDDQYHQTGQYSKRRHGRADAAIDACESEELDDTLDEDVSATIVRVSSPSGEGGEIADAVAQIVSKLGDGGGAVGGATDGADDLGGLEDLEDPDAFEASGGTDDMGDEGDDLGGGVPGDELGMEIEEPALDDEAGPPEPEESDQLMTQDKSEPMKPKKAKEDKAPKSPPKPPKKEKSDDSDDSDGDEVEESLDVRLSRILGEDGDMTGGDSPPKADPDMDEQQGTGGVVKSKKASTSAKPSKGGGLAAPKGGVKMGTELQGGDGIGGVKSKAGGGMKPAKGGEKGMDELQGSDDITKHKGKGPTSAGTSMKGGEKTKVESKQYKRRKK